MSRSGVFYAVKAMERAAAGDEPVVPAGRAADHQGATAAHPDGSTWFSVRRVLAAVRDRIGDAAGRVGQGRPLGGAARAD